MTAKIRKLLYCARIRARARTTDCRYFTIKNSAIGRVGDFPQNKRRFLQNKGHFPQNKGLFPQNKGHFPQNKGHFPKNKGSFLRISVDNLPRQQSLSPTTLEGLFHDVAILPINPWPLICPSFFFRKFAGREQDAQTIFLQDQHKWN